RESPAPATPPASARGPGGPGTGAVPPRRTAPPARVALIPGPRGPRRVVCDGATSSSLSSEARRRRAGRASRCRGQCRQEKGGLTSYTYEVWVREITG